MGTPLRGSSSSCRKSCRFGVFSAIGNDSPLGYAEDIPDLAYNGTASLGPNYGSTVPIFDPANLETTQILNLLYCIGYGEYDVTNIKVGDTPIGNFEDVQYELYAPGEEVKLFPTNVKVATGVKQVDDLITAKVAVIQGHEILAESEAATNRG